jgi:hypothetical protein
MLLGRSTRAVQTTGPSVGATAMSVDVRQAAGRAHRVVIVGCGFGGLAAAKSLGAPPELTSPSSTGRITTWSNRSCISSPRGFFPKGISPCRFVMCCDASGTRALSSAT